jgi:hypothetical protein
MPLLARGVPLHLSPTAVRAINSRQMSRAELAELRARIARILAA